MSGISDGIALVRKGRWDDAHRIAQADESQRGSWFHGILHIIEGDEDNARYWYRLAGRPFPGMQAVEAELLALAAGI